MHLETAQSLSHDDVTEEQIRQAFADDSRRGEFAILTADNGDYLQASGDGDGPYSLEYRVAETSDQFQAIDDPTKSEVEAAFLSYLAGDSRWKESHRWKPVELSSNSSPGLGCASVLGVLFFIVVAAVVTLFSQV